MDRTIGARTALIVLAAHASACENAPAERLREHDAGPVRPPPTPVVPDPPDTGRIESGDAAVAHREDSGEPTPCIHIAQSLIRFDAARAPGLSAGGSVRITNACEEGSWSVLSATIAPASAPFSVLTRGLPITLGPRSTITLALEYVRRSLASESGRLIITTNDPLRSRIELPLVTQDVPAVGIRVDPQTLDFGAVTYRAAVAGAPSDCASPTMSVHLLPAGIVEVRRLALGGDPGFSIQRIDVGGASWPSSVPFTIGPHAGRLDLRFRPPRPDGTPEYRAEIAIEHDAAPEPARIRLLASATPAGSFEDSFEVSFAPGADVLWVVGQGEPVRDHLASAQATFVTAADQRGGDYRVGIALAESSTESGGLNRCPGRPLIPDATIPPDERAGAIRCAILTPPPGRRRPAIAAAGSALRGALRQFGPPGDRSTVIVFVGGFDAEPAADSAALADALLADAGNTKLTAHAIATDPISPYPAIAHRLGGYSYPDRADLSGVMVAIAQSALTPARSWVLSAAAQPSTIRVAVDGVDAGASTNGAWRYDSDENRISLLFEPRVGQRVTVSYDSLCLP